MTTTRISSGRSHDGKLEGRETAELLSFMIDDLLDPTYPRATSRGGLARMFHETSGLEIYHFNKSQPTQIYWIFVNTVLAVG
jgi:hypothetical protein